MVNGQQKLISGDVGNAHGDGNRSIDPAWRDSQNGGEDFGWLYGSYLPLEMWPVMAGEDDGDGLRVAYALGQTAKQS